VPGAWCLVPGAWCLALGHLVLFGLWPGDVLELLQGLPGISLLCGNLVTTS
jgi:hypothetical protein